MKLLKLLLDAIVGAAFLVLMVGLVVVASLYI